jgi:pyruvate formate lyase activating enzyme
MQAYAQENLKEAMLYTRRDDNRVLCHLCPHRCLIDHGKRGICQVRENRDGTLYTLIYEHPIVQNVDPVEKKPLFHFYPGSTTYSIATQGCNFHCPYCINWQISQVAGAQLQHTGTEVSPEQIVSAALQARCYGIAYTYVEPTIFFEYAYDIARLAHAAGLLNIYKTNGFMTAEMLDMSHPYLDAANVDLKTFRHITYQQFGGRLQPVLDSLKHMKALGIWLEISTVLIPSINDDPAELRDLASFIARELGDDTPWHIARFFPAFKMEHVPPTSIRTLYRAREIGWDMGLHHVYFSNLLRSGTQDTLCTSCKRILIRRHGCKLLANTVQSGSCPDCRTKVAGIGI